MSQYRDFSLAQWLEHIQSQHWRTIELSLDRVSEVWQKLNERFNVDKLPLVVTIAGTNGKGSCVAMLESILRHGGLTTGSYTSPHLVRYNERICINGLSVSDTEICSAFCEIERARGNIPLTYFEFGTLCALLIFQQSEVDAWILETGMGGRLDAVNIIENNVALITSIGVDHEQWLGSDREVIGREKAGVFKPRALAVCAEPEPPASIAGKAKELQTTLLQSGIDFQITVEDNQDSYSWRGNHSLVPEHWRQIDNLDLPIAGTHQAQNLSGVIAVLALTQERTGIEPDDIYLGLAATRISARCQVIAQSPTIVLDVAHNTDSAEELATYLRSHPVSGETYAVLGVLKDKELGPILTSISDNIDHWFLAGLEGERGQTAEQLGQRLEETLPASRYKTFSNPVAAYDAARQVVNTADRIVIFGSFYTVGDIIGSLEQQSSVP